jgi:hypothetical protein
MAYGMSDLAVTETEVLQFAAAHGAQLGLGIAGARGHTQAAPACRQVAPAKPNDLGQGAHVRSLLVR